MVTGTASLNGGSPGLATVNLAGSAAFTSNTTYVCTVGNVTAVGGTAFVTRVTGAQFTLTGDNTSTNTYFFVCVGH
jgi:hypothetical protein